MTIQRHTLSATSVKTFPNLVEGHRLIFETKPLSGDAIDDGKAMGEVVVSTAVAGVDDVEIGRQKLIPGDRPLFIVPGGITGPFRLTGELFPWITGSYLVTVWASTVEADSDDDVSSGPDNCALAGELIDFLPIPSADGIAIAPGLAVFTAGETTFQLPSASQPDYSQQYSVRGDAFWGVGARSLSTYSEGTFSFVSGTGRSVLGLVAQFPEVNFRLMDWAWYVHSPSQVYAFERESGQIIRSAGGHPWSPDKPLSLTIANGRIQYGIGGITVYESPIPVTNPLYFAAVLGPQAFVINCLRA